MFNYLFGFYHRVFSKKKNRNYIASIAIGLLVLNFKVSLRMAAAMKLDETFGYGGFPRKTHVEFRIPKINIHFL